MLYWVSTPSPMCSAAKLTGSLVQGFLIGAILPVIPWYLYRRTGRPIWRQINVPLVLHGVRFLKSYEKDEWTRSLTGGSFAEHRSAANTDERPRSRLHCLFPEPVLRTAVSSALVRQGIACFCGA